MKKKLLFALALAMLLMLVCLTVAAQAEFGDFINYYTLLTVSDLSSDGNYATCENSAGYAFMPTIRQDGSAGDLWYKYITENMWDNISEDWMRVYDQYNPDSDKIIFGAHSIEEFAASRYANYVLPLDSVPTSLRLVTLNDVDCPFYIKNNNSQKTTKVRFTIWVAPKRNGPYTEVQHWDEITKAGGSFSDPKIVDPDRYPKAWHASIVDGVDTAWAPLKGEADRTYQFTYRLVDQYGVKWYQQEEGVTWSLDNASEGISLDSTGKLTVTGSVPLGGARVTVKVTGPDGEASCRSVLVINPRLYIGGSGTASDPWTIEDTGSWYQLTELVDNGFSTSGKYFRMTNDITVDTMIGTESNPFNGSFDGAGHSLEFYHNATDSCCAPFRRVGSASFSNIVITGWINSDYSNAGGLVGEVVTSCEITNCRSEIRIKTTESGAKNHGGFVGIGKNITLRGCVFCGEITGEAGSECAGFLGKHSGDNSSSCIDCLYDGTGVEVAGTSSLGPGFRSITNFYCVNTHVDTATIGLAGYRITPDSGVELDFGSGSTYSVGGHTVLQGVVMYKGVFYAIGGRRITLSLACSDCPADRVARYSVNEGTLTQKDDGWELFTNRSGLDTVISVTFADPLAGVPGSGTRENPWRIGAGHNLELMRAGWYKVTENASFTRRVAVHGSVNLSLGAGTTLTASRGINVSEGNSLTISGTGTLNAVGCEGCAGIGAGISESCGTVTINSGTVNATGSVWGAGIGGGKGGGSGGSITINGGYVTAQCYDPNNDGVGLAAGIGGGDTGSGGTILITGGTVYARGNRGSAGIGGGGYGSGGTITITGGTVTAVGSAYEGGRSGAGIGAGRVRNNATAGDSGNITITGGTVIAIGGDNAQAIGLSDEVAANDSGTLTLGDGLKVTAGDSESTAVVATGDLVTACRSPWAKVEGANSIPAFGEPDFTLPAFLTTIEEEAFEGADMHIVWIPDTCLSIGDHAFRNCMNLTQIRIPAGCMLGEDVFDGCDEMYVYVYSAAGSPAEAYCSSHDNCIFVDDAPY